MKAILIRDGKLVWEDAPIPELRDGEVLVKVRATAINRADLSQRSGRYPPPPGASEILGLECSGVIEKVGPGVSNRQVGQEVCALLAGGGYAEYAAVPAGHTLPPPAGMDLETAAGVVEVFATAWLNLRLEGELKDGERVLVHAGASGVGTACIQLCKAWGNPIFVTVGDQAKREYCEQLGASASANRHDPWDEAVRGWGGADVILDPVGGSYLEMNVNLLKPRGRLVNIGLMGGAQGTLPMGVMMVKRLCLRGSVLRSRSIEEKNQIIAGLQREVWPLLESGQIKPIIDKVFAIQDAEQAHELVGSNNTIGKVLLRV
ncbi:MAG: NAD(P)H-quinone oxidoreductase [Candidatus Eremiobacteraeota bacterium]|nr:NAD(P)H-quinone oxidoreductase [Candidatus Eremiobacteraeota bacterium]